MLEREVERLSARVATLESEKRQTEAFAAVTAHELMEPLVMTEAYASILSERLEGPEHERSRADQGVGLVCEPLDERRAPLEQLGQLVSAQLPR